MIAVRTQAPGDVSAPPSAPRLAELARAASHAVQRGAWDAGAVAGELTAQLEAMRRVSPESRGPAAEAVLALLDGGVLDGVHDARAVPAHYVAVETLLHFGYPWALRLTPEDLERHHRTRPFSDKRRATVRAGFLVGTAGAVAVGLGVWATSRDTFPGHWLEWVVLGAIVAVALTSGIAALTVAGSEEGVIASRVAGVVGVLAAVILALPTTLLVLLFTTGDLMGLHGVGMLAAFIGVFVGVIGGARRLPAPRQPATRPVPAGR